MIADRAIVGSEDRVQSLSELETRAHLVRGNRPCLRRPVARCAGPAVRAKTLEEWSCQIHTPGLTEGLDHAARIWKTDEIWCYGSGLPPQMGYRDQQADQDDNSARPSSKLRIDYRECFQPSHVSSGFLFDLRNSRPKLAIKTEFYGPCDHDNLNLPPASVTQIKGLGTER